MKKSILILFLFLFAKKIEAQTAYDKGYQQTVSEINNAVYGTSTVPTTTTVTTPKSNSPTSTGIKDLDLSFDIYKNQYLFIPILFPEDRVILKDGKLTIYKYIPYTPIYYPLPSSSYIIK